MTKIDRANFTLTEAAQQNLNDAFSAHFAEHAGIKGGNSPRSAGRLRQTMEFLPQADGGLKVKTRKGDVMMLGARDWELKNKKAEPVSKAA